MQKEVVELLNLNRLPGRLNQEQAASILGFKPHDIPVLTAKNKLKPLGTPRANHQKYFSTVDVEELSKDSRWLSDATKVVQEYWHVKNGKKLKNENLKPGVAPTSDSTKGIPVSP